MNSYHNTTHRSGQQLEIAEASAYTQDQRILKMFERYPGACLTPYQVQVRAQLEHVPITSVRRAMSNLTRDGHLIKNDIKKTERYGAPNYTWSLHQPVTSCLAGRQATEQGCKPSERRSPLIQTSNN